MKTARSRRLDEAAVFASLRKYGSLAACPKSKCYVRTDGGSEWRGAFKTWIEDQQAAHPGMYTHTMTSGSRASGNSVAERTIASVRRIIGAHCRSVEADWNARARKANFLK